MDRYRLYVREADDGVSRKIGAAKVENPEVGEILRIPVKQYRYSDLQVLSIDEEERTIILERVEGTAHYLHLLEHLVYKFQESRQVEANTNVEQVEATKSLLRVCHDGAAPAECQRIAELTNDVERKLKEKRDG